MYKLQLKFVICTKQYIIYIFANEFANLQKSFCKFCNPLDKKEGRSADEGADKGRGAINRGLFEKSNEKWYNINSKKEK